ncbi:MAG: winged helix-turn-helix transcriptional regulator [Oscillospiraceae bacterium]|nr:winged helix-turn-helix transcriptional regulator [Oscillospiraceae bacterium]
MTIRPHKAFAVDETVSETVSETVNRQAKILAILAENPKITVRQIVEIFDLSRTTVSRELRSLKQANRIRRVGSDKSGHWHVVE